MKVLALFWLILVQKAQSNLNSSKKLHYAIVVDAGSSGSRCFLYHWPEHTGNPDELLKITPLSDESGEPLVHATTPGLSSFGNKPDEAFDYIKPLMQFAADHIPQDQHKDTPLFILATAGMRLIKPGLREAIMKNVRQGIQTNFQFHFPDSNLQIITGAQEGIYQWLAINYVLNRFDQPDEVRVVNKEIDDTQTQQVYIHPGTVGALDMGGASMQMAVEVTSDLYLEEFTEEEKSKVVEVNLGCRASDNKHQYRLFVKSFLGYGSNEAIARYRRHLILSQFDEKNGENSIIGLSPESPIKDPCLPIGFEEEVTLQFKWDRLVNPKAKEMLQPRQNIYLSGLGEWDKCFETLATFIKSSEPYFSPCTGKPGCPNDGMKMPPMPLEHTDYYGFSEFWYSSEDVADIGGPYDFKTLSTVSKEFCGDHWDNIMKNFNDGKYKTTDMDRLKHQCMKSAWIAVALHEGLKFPRNFHNLNSVANSLPNGQVVHWTIGAILYRTRFYPLRTIQEAENQNSSEANIPPPSDWDYQLWHYMALFLLAITLTSILLYLKRCKRFVKPSAMRKVESLAFMRNTSPISPTSGLKAGDILDIEKGMPKQFEPGLVLPKL